jgi:hypothetical protein
MGMCTFSCWTGISAAIFYGNEVSVDLDTIHWAGIQVQRHRIWQAQRNYNTLKDTKAFSLVPWYPWTPGHNQIKHVGRDCLIHYYNWWIGLTVVPLNWLLWASVNLSSMLITWHPTPFLSLLRLPLFIVEEIGLVKKDVKPNTLINLL